MTVSRFDPPVVVGLVGGVASGKSAVARLFEEAGLERIDADAEARRVVERPEVRAGIRARFGDTFFATDGALDRAALANTVFSDPDARADLEALTHPAIRAEIVRRLDAARAGGRSVVLDVPLLLEGGLVERCDAVVFVDAPDDARKQRAATRGWNEEEFLRREASQMALAVKKSRSTATIDNSGSLERARAQVTRLLQEWGRRRPDRTRSGGPRS